jgi:hypothetical protein
VSENRTCPLCRSSLAAKAVLCIACGYDFRTGKRRQTVCDSHERHWTTGREMGVRAAYAVGVLAVIAAAALLHLAPADRLLLGIAGVLLAVVLGLGTFVRITLKRDGHGVWRLTKQRWVAFVPCGRVTVDLRRYDAVYVDCRAGPALSWHSVLLERQQPDVYLLELGGRRVRKRLRIYRGMSETTMKEMVDTLQELAGLSVERK